MQGQENKNSFQRLIRFREEVINMRQWTSDNVLHLVSFSLMNHLRQSSFDEYDDN